LRPACDVCVHRAVDGYRECPIVSGTAEVSAVVQRAAVGAEARYEGIDASTIAKLRAVRGRKVGGTGPTGGDDVAVVGHRDRSDAFLGAAAEESTDNDRRIDN
jgi:hypothetical protein